ncbi:hypothetical protein [Mucilaginibacter sp. OK098]|nr:hypothetical protein [Mucilaginibacter sp. OK098]
MITTNNTINQNINVTLISLSKKREMVIRALFSFLRIPALFAICR